MYALKNKHYIGCKFTQFTERSVVLMISSLERAQVNLGLGNLGKGPREPPPHRSERCLLPVSLSFSLCLIGSPEELLLLEEKELEIGFAEVGSQVRVFDNQVGGRVEAVEGLIVGELLYDLRLTIPIEVARKI